MLNPESKRLLQDKRVMDEINRHKWIESEKAGYDIGFEKAAEDWISHYADEWEDKNSDKRSKKFIKPKRKDKSIFD